MKTQFKRIIQYYRESNYIHSALKPLSDFFNRISFYFISDEAYSKLNFGIDMGYKLDLKNPITLNEKIQWLKLHDRSELQTICADKYAVREFVRSKIGDQYLVPLAFTTDNTNEIIEENFPDYPVIVKANHGCGSNRIIRDKSATNWKALKKVCRNWLRNNYYHDCREWQYKNIKPRIVVEKLLIDPQWIVPFDYKFHCFNGRVVTIQVDMGRGTDNHCRNWYNRKWEREPFKWSSLKKGKATDPSPSNVDKPEMLEELITLSEKLSNDFLYVRVDWYIVNGSIYFGELTFHHDGGFRPILPYEWDKKLGEMLNLKQ
jgi:hypothetical protein